MTAYETQILAGKVPVERLRVGDKVRAVATGPDGTVTKTCADAYAGWMTVVWKGRGTDAARTLPYKAGQDALYLLEVNVVSATTPHLPDGYTVKREERPASEYREAEVTWTVLGPDGARVSDPRVHRTQRVDHLSGDGDEYRVVNEWVVHPGFTTAGISVADARARAAVLLLAADEAEGRNQR